MDYYRLTIDLTLGILNCLTFERKYTYAMSCGFLITVLLCKGRQKKKFPLIANNIIIVNGGIGTHREILYSRGKMQGF